MTLVVVGDVNRRAVEGDVRELFGPYPLGPLPARPRTAEPPQRQPRLSGLDMNVEESYLYLGFPIPEADHADIFALDLLGFILGGGESSRLVQTVQVEKELVNWISASAYSPADPGLFITAAALEQDKVRPALQAMLAAIAGCQHRLVSPAELDRARTNLASDFTYRRETVQGQARQLGYFLSVFDDPDYEDRYLAGLAAVTRQDIRRVAQRYLTTDSLSARTTRLRGPGWLAERGGHPDLAGNAACPHGFGSRKRPGLVYRVGQRHSPAGQGASQRSGRLPPGLHAGRSAV